MNETVVPFDLVRMFFGTDPALFYLEIVFRTCLIYLYALLLIRWVGGRGIAQMSTVEFLLVIALGSAVGDAMFYPEVPILHAMLVITAVVVVMDTEYGSGVGRSKKEAEQKAAAATWKALEALDTAGQSSA